MISQLTIQQILSRIDIIDIVGSFVKLKKRGTNYLGLCPFHNEKTPSFTVSPAKEIYKCFGCGKSGNTISFLMEHEKYSYAEALRWLANRYNVEVEETEVSPATRALHQTADSLYIINNFAQQFFSTVLLQSEEGQDIGLSYLKERGFSTSIIEKFQLGYCSQQRDAFAKAALAAQYNAEYLQKTGLVVLRDEQLVDNYRGRIIFPIHNQTGKIMGFGARIIGKSDRAPKYINTPENEIYIKSKILYGSYFARQAIDKADECLLVEGYTDVISLHQAGIEHVVASGGTSLTPDQLRLIKKYTANLTIIYDGDAAGIKAALRGLDLALEEGLHVQLVLLPGNEDPDSYVNKTGGEAFKQFVADNKKDIVLFQLEVSLKDAGSDSNKKAAVVNRIAETISRLNKAEDFTKQQDYIRQCAGLLKIDETGLNTLVNKFIRERITKQENKMASDDAKLAAETGVQETATTEEEALTLLNKDELIERNMARALIEFGGYAWDEKRKVADYFFEEFEINGLHELIDNKQMLWIIETYQSWIKEGIDPSPQRFLYHPDMQLSAIVVALMDTRYELSPNWKDHYDGPLLTREDRYKEEVSSTLIYLKLRKIKRLIDENQRDLEKTVSAEEQLTLMQTHLHFKQLEKTLTTAYETVIFK
ncbi:DNA primase [Agriterribacter sp.]|uniref:DNA primase n=1 Tax=Agriterribacter sp. TaxID=2821509 RepID=UPI002C8ED421|nr:DNA primase [Agriterribacter sp.]HRO46788.1 DNA primase [Agriterribacter sp.]HRQ19343.1 DNA primase [Agriterribacter sp.]